jgi:hypothetical protein
MSDHALEVLLPSLNLVPFERRPDGSFASLLPPPDWFRPRTSDGVFPFLGHILEEATAFWDLGANGVQEWGPCADVDPEGREFHYKVIGVQTEGRQFLVFQLDRESDRMREVLQKVRDNALTDERQARGLVALASLARRTTADMHELLGKLQNSGLSPEQLAIVEDIDGANQDLADRVAAVAAAGS